MDCVIRLFGCNVPRNQARWLVTTLNADGRPDALLAARDLSRALKDEAPSTALSPPMRDAILRVIPDPPPSSLKVFRASLAKDQDARN